ncbi:MAG: hypothetical protein DRG39_05505 [Deltaproteobacteria bacterium]|nr:MAG: hypothetical protein DRG39_05505 [Deltaproteobacteria bacterium]
MEEPTLFDYWLALYRRRYIIITIIISSMIIAYFLSKTLPPVYEAKVVFFVPYKFPSISFYSPDAPKEISRHILLPPTMEEFLAPYIGILKSKALANLVHNKFPQKSIRDLKKDVDFQVNNEYMLEIYVRDKDPRLAADIANAYVRYFNKLNSQYSLIQTFEQIKTLQRQISENKRHLENAQEILEKFQKEHKIADLEKEMEQLISQKSIFEQKMKETEVNLKEANKKIESLRAQLAKEAQMYMPSELVTTSPLIENLREKLSDLEAKMAKLKVEYKETHPEFLSAKKEHEQIKANLAKEIDRVIKSRVKSPKSFYEKLRQDLVELYIDQQSLKARRNGYHKVLENIERRLKNIPYLKLKVKELSKEVERYQNSLNSLKLALEEAKAQKVRDIKTVVIVDKATPPSSPSFPICWLNILVAGMAGLIAGIFYAFLLDYIERKSKERKLKIIDLIKADKYWE